MAGPINEVPMQQRRERRDASANRQRIVAVARRLFAERGVDATSMNMIAQEAHVGPGTLYRHFAHKGAVCAALLEDDIAAFQQRAEALLDDAGGRGSALTQLEQLLDALMDMVETHIPLLTAMQEAASGERRHDRYQSPFYHWLHAQLVRLLECAIKENEVTELDAVFTADAIFGAIAPPLYAFQRQERGFSHERIAAGVRRLFIDGLRVDKGTATSET
jgi:AcrR family transcriptional regulator